VLHLHQHGQVRQGVVSGNWCENVGTIEINENCQIVGYEISKKKKDVSVFRSGRSSIIVAFEKRRVHFDDDLLDFSRGQVMMGCINGHEHG